MASELLVNRGMNVWGSGGAHNTYFKKVDEIIVEIFNRPLEQQPGASATWAAATARFLEHLYSAVKNQTARGTVLDKHPLTLVGADFNKVARRVTKQTTAQGGHSRHSRDSRRYQPPGAAGERSRGAGPGRARSASRPFVPRSQPAVPSARRIMSGGTRIGKSTGAFAHFGRRNSMRRTGRESGPPLAALGALCGHGSVCWHSNCIRLPPESPRRI